MAGLPANSPEIVWERCAPGRNSCLIWTGGLDHRGYGRVRIQGRYHLAHRVAYGLWHAVTLDRSELLLHSCDNPRCINPHHLRIGTHRENTQDMFSRNRQGAQSRKQFTTEQVRERRRLRAQAYRKTDKYKAWKRSRIAGYAGCGYEADADSGRISD